jgi:hypothetical protein
MYSIFESYPEGLTYASVMRPVCIIRFQFVFLFELWGALLL